MNTQHYHVSAKVCSFLAFQMEIFLQPQKWHTSLNGPDNLSEKSHSAQQKEKSGPWVPVIFPLKKYTHNWMCCKRIDASARSKRLNCQMFPSSSTPISSRQHLKEFLSQVIWEHIVHIFLIMYWFLQWYNQKCSNIFHSGQGGVGKSTSLKQLARLWANKESGELKQFDIVFHIALRFVKSNEPLAEIILKQHKGLSRQNVSSAKIAQILKGETQQKVLLMLDGHDEYTPGANTDIDNAITKHSLPNCCILLTSRDRSELNEIRPYMDVEADITGFHPSKVKEYITKYLDSAKECKRLMQMAKESKLISTKAYRVMQVPIMLHMICVLYLSKDKKGKMSLPKTKTGVIAAIVERCPDWDEIRRSGKKTEAEMKVLLDEALVNLGRLCWERLQQGKEDLIFTQASSVSVICLSLRNSLKGLCMMHCNHQGLLRPIQLPSTNPHVICVPNVHCYCAFSAWEQLLAQHGHPFLRQNERSIELQLRNIDCQPEPEIQRWCNAKSLNWSENSFPFVDRMRFWRRLVSMPWSWGFWWELRTTRTQRSNRKCSASIISSSWSSALGSTSAPLLRQVNWMECKGNFVRLPTAALNLLISLSLPCFLASFLFWSGYAYFFELHKVFCSVLHLLCFVRMKSRNHIQQCLQFCPHLVHWGKWRVSRFRLSWKSCFPRRSSSMNTWKLWGLRPDCLRMWERSWVKSICSMRITQRTQSIWICSGKIHSSHRTCSERFVPHRRFVWIWQNSAKQKSRAWPDTARWWNWNCVGVKKTIPKISSVDMTTKYFTI